MGRGLLPGEVGCSPGFCAGLRQDLRPSRGSDDGHRGQSGSWLRLMKHAMAGTLITKPQSSPG